MDPVNFKVYLNEPDKDQEVRRISVDKDVSTNLLYLQSKLSNLFPVLKRKDNAITWTDEDGDVITIGSDEELIIALTEMKGPLYKLNVNVKAGEKKVNDDDEETVEQAEAAQAQTPHPGVVCDGCDKPVVGFRYKCVECPDYDLCSACEAKGNVHPGHNFLRIASPDTMWPKHFFKRLNKMHDRIHRRAHSAAVNKDHDLNEEFDYWFNHGAGGRGRGGHHRPCGMGMGRGGGLFGSMMNGWRGEAGGANRFPGQGATVGGAKPNNAQGQQQQEQRQQQQQEKKATTPQQQDGGDFLRFLGNVIANTLDPMGVDVQVDVEDAKGERETVAKTTKTTTSGSTTTTTSDENGVKTFTTTFSDKKGDGNEEEVIEKGQEPEVATCVEPAKEVQAVEVNGAAAAAAAAMTYCIPKAPTLAKETGAKPKVNGDERSKTPESDDNEDGWTLVDQKENKNVNIPITVAKEDKKEQDEIQVPIQVSNQPAKVLMNEADKNGIYPNLNDAEKPKEDKQEQPAQEEMDPRIAVALQAMLNMGFTNDGGWLTKLLESKDGDIGRVLDTLTPTRPVRN